MKAISDDPLQVQVMAALKPPKWCTKYKIFS